VHWRRVLLWLACGTASGVLAGTIVGAIGGLFDPIPGESVTRLLLGGAIGGMGAALTFLFVGFPLFVATVLAWALLARVAPGLEESPVPLALGLSVPAAAVGLGFFLAFPEERHAALFVALLAPATLVAPRFLVPPLRSGAFAPPSV